MSASPVAGPSTPARSSSGIIYRSMSVVDSRTRTPGPLLSSLSRSSTPGYLPPRYRSASVFTSEAAERANDIDRQRRQAAQKCMSTWEALMDKYGAIAVEDDDEVDIITGKIVVNRGRVEKMQEVDIGGILGSPDDGSDDGATEGGDIDPDRDELAGWSDEEVQRDNAHVLAHRPWTHEDDADLAAFKRAETERRALNDEDELDIAPPVALLFPSKDEALPRRMREPSVAHWQHGTRVYESSTDLHSRSSSRAPIVSEGDDSDDASENGNVSESPSVEEHAPPIVTLTSVQQRATINRSSLPSFKQSRAPRERITREPPVSLSDLFTPTPSPPPSESLTRFTTLSRPTVSYPSSSKAPADASGRPAGRNASTTRRDSDPTDRLPAASMPATSRSAVSPPTAVPRVSAAGRRATAKDMFLASSSRQKAPQFRQRSDRLSDAMQGTRTGRSERIVTEAPHDFAGDEVDFFAPISAPMQRPLVAAKSARTVKPQRVAQTGAQMGGNQAPNQENSQIATPPRASSSDPAAGPSSAASAQLSSTPAAGPTPMVKRKYIRRNTTEPPLPVPAPEDVEPPNDPERYFTHIHRLNPNTVRSCRLCRVSKEAPRRAKSYYCKGRQNADWCLLAKEAGEEVTPVRDRNRAVKERKRAMTEARQSMLPEDVGSASRPKMGEEGSGGSRVTAEDGVVSRVFDQNMESDPAPVRIAKQPVREPRLAKEPRSHTTPAKSGTAASRLKTPIRNTPSTPGKRKRNDPVPSWQYEEDACEVSISPSPGLAHGLPPSSPVDVFSPAPPSTSRMALPTPSPTASAEKYRGDPASSPLSTRYEAHPSALPTPPRSNGNRSASLASEEYTLPKTLPRPRLRSILRHSSSTPYLSDNADSDTGRSGSTKRARFSLLARSPTHDDVSYDAGDLVYPSDDCASSPIKSWRGRSSSASMEEIPRELAVRAADAGVHLTGHSGRLPSHLLRVLAPHLGIYPPSPNAGPSRSPVSRVEKTKSTESPGLMLPPPIPARIPATPTRPSPLVKTNSAPAAIRRQRSLPPPVEEISTPIIFRQALPLHVRASMARSRSRSRSHSVSVAAIKIEFTVSDPAHHHSTPSLKGKGLRRSQSARTLSHFEDLGPAWGLDDDIL